MKNSMYRQITVQDLITFVKANAKMFPQGLGTPIYSGDFEGNYCHQQHEIQYIAEEGIASGIFLGYEMHENFLDNI